MEGKRQKSLKKGQCSCRIFRPDKQLRQVFQRENRLR